MEQLPKYYYKPILSNVEKVYLENAKTEYNPGMDIESNVRLVVEADDLDSVNKAIIGFVDIGMWELETPN